MVHVYTCGESMMSLTLFVFSNSGSLPNVQPLHSQCTQGQSYLQQPYFTHIPPQPYGLFAAHPYSQLPPQPYGQFPTPQPYFVPAPHVQQPYFHNQQDHWPHVHGWVQYTHGQPFCGPPLSATFSQAEGELIENKSSLPFSH